MENEIAKIDQIQGSFSKEDKALYKTLQTGIKNSFAKAEKAFFHIASCLYTINEQGLFHIDGYKTIIDFSLEKYGYKSSKTYALIGMVKRFGAIDDSGMCLGIKEEFNAFKPSQLEKMLAIEDEHLSDVKPEWTVKEIIDFRNSLKDLNVIEAPQKKETEEEIPGIPKPEPMEEIEVSPEDESCFLAKVDKPEKLTGLQDQMKDIYKDFCNDGRYKDKKLYFEIRLCWE